MKELFQLLYSIKLLFVEKMVTGLQSYNTSPASGFSVSFNEETSPHYTERERQREGRYCSLILKFVRMTVNCYFVYKWGKKSIIKNIYCILFKVNRNHSGLTLTIIH